MNQFYGYVRRVFPGSNVARVVMEQHGEEHNMVIETQANTGDPASGAGEVWLPRRGARVVCVWDGTHWILKGNAVRDDLVRGDPPRVCNQADVGAADPHYALEEYFKYNQEKANDAIPGDWAKLGTEGNGVGVLEGGVTYLKGSELAQIVASRMGDLVRMVSRNYQHFSSFGVSEIKNEDGSVTYEILGATSEKASRAEQWQFRVKVGGDDALYTIETYEPGGELLTRVYADNDGSLHLQAAGDIEMNAGGAVQTRSEGPLEQRFSARSVEVEAGDVENIGGDKDVNVEENYNLNVGGVVNEASADRRELVRGDKQTRVTGDVKETLQKGSKVVDLTLGKVTYNTHRRPGSINLGSASPRFHAVKYEELKALLDDLVKRFDQHVHGSAAGPTTPPTMPATPFYMRLIQKVRSLVVKVD